MQIGTAITAIAAIAAIFGFLLSEHTSGVSSVNFPLTCFLGLVAGDAIAFKNPPTRLGLVKRVRAHFEHLAFSQRLPGTNPPLA